MGEAIDLPLCLTTYQFNPYQLLLVVVTRSERLKSKPYWEGFAYIRNGFGNWTTLNFPNLREEYLVSPNFPNLSETNFPLLLSSFFFLRSRFRPYK
jgi:hypothetical protein